MWEVPALPPISPKVANFFLGGSFELDDGGGGKLELVGSCWGVDPLPRVRPPLRIGCVEVWFSGSVSESSGKVGELLAAASSWAV